MKRLQSHDKRVKYDTILGVGMRKKVTIALLIAVGLTEVAMTVGDQVLRKEYGQMSAERLAVADLRETPRQDTLSVGEIRQIVGSGVTEIAEERQSVRLQDRATWERESGFLVRSGLIRQGAGPWVVRQVPDNDHTIDEATKVLAISDSHGWGVGLHDIDQTWSRRMERELNSLTHPFGYRVTNLGRPYTSFYDYAETLAGERFSREDPDIIVIGYHTNDAIPSGYEKMICGQSAQECEVGDSSTFPTYRRCITGGDGVLGSLITRVVQPRHASLAAWMLERYCNTDRFNSQAALPTEGEMASDPARNPYTPYFRKAARMIMYAAQGRPVLVVPIEPQNQTNRFLEILKEEGLEVMDTTKMTETYELTAHKPFSESDGVATWDQLQIHPADCCHFGTVYSAALGRDAARAVRTLVGPGMKVEGPIGRSLVGNYLPADLTVEQQGEKVLVAHRPVDGKEENNPKDWILPCASQGRPHVQVMFDRNDVIGRQLRVTLERTTSPLLFALTGYDEENRWVTGPFRALPAGEGYRFTVDERSTGLIVASEETGCPLKQQHRMPGFVMTVDRLD
jgi:hypothetical protein